MSDLISIPSVEYRSNSTEIGAVRLRLEADSTALGLLSDLHWQAEEIDEASGGGDVVSFHAEAGELRIIQRVRTAGRRRALARPL